MPVGRERKIKIRDFFAAEGFPKKATLKYAQGQGFDTLAAFWEDANKQYEDAQRLLKQGNRKVAYQKKKEYNKERNKGLRDAKKRFTVDMRKILKNERYYNAENPIWEGRSTQREVNSKPKAFMQKMMQLQNDGRFTVHGAPGQMWESLKGLNGRHHVSYITKDGLYRAGGFLRISKDDDLRATMEKEKYITLAQPKQRLSWPVQLKDIDTFYIKEIKPKVDKIEPTDMKPTNFPVEINGIVVYYAKDSWKQTRFKNTARYKAMLELAKS